MNETASGIKNDCSNELRCIGLRIAYFRKLRNITQADLADQVYINKNYLSHIESGSANKAVSLPVLIRIAQALKVDLSLLTNLSDCQNNELHEFVREMRETFEEMKALNEELDDYLRQMNNLDDLDEN